MLSLTGVCTLFAVGTLFFILGYLFVHGGSSLTWDFFTKLPTPVGETGGGMANAIVGSAKLLLLATLIGVPIGFLGGVYLAEFGGSDILLRRPLHHRPAERRAVHRHRHLRLHADRAAAEAFLDAGRRRRPGRHDDSHRRPQHRRVSCAPFPIRCARAPWPWAPPKPRPF